MAPKLLAWADAGRRTGFERVAREILTPLHESGKFDVHLMGIGYRGELQYPYPVHTAGSDRDILGIYSFAENLKKYQPDVIWTIQDLWNITSYATFKDPAIPMAVYFPVDAPNLKWNFALGLGAVSAAATYARFGAIEAAAGVRDVVDLFQSAAVGHGRSLDEPLHWSTIDSPVGGKLNVRMDRVSRYQNVGAFTIVPHGLDRSLFGVRDKQAARKVFGIPEDAFVVLNVNTNQFRKRLDLTFRAFAMFAETCPRATLVLHCAGHTIQGWDLEQLAMYYGVRNRTFLVHEELDEITDDQLVELYNTADVQINTAGGEGWGLTSIEGAACGVPQLVPDWSVTRELWAGHGHLLPIKDYRMEPKFLNTCHAEIDVQEAAMALQAVAYNETYREMLRHQGFALIETQLSWQEVSERMGRVMDQALAEHEMQPRCFNEMMAERIDVVKSELAGRPLYRPD